MSIKYYSKTSKKDRFGTGLKLVLIFVLLIVVISVVIFFVFFFKEEVEEYYKAREQNLSYKKVFNQKNYSDLINKMNVELKDNPYMTDYLIYRGYSLFILGENEKRIEKKLGYFKPALIDLRKALAIGVDTKNIDDVYFCIGKIYFYMGVNYYDLCIKYCNKARSFNGKRDDLYYILGLCYSFVGDYKSSVESFIELSKNNSSDQVFYAIATIFFKMGDYNSSKLYLESIVNRSKDNRAKEEAYLLLGQILFDEKDIKKSEICFDKILEINENNSMAYFYKGEIIYHTENNISEARKFWMEARDIDPSNQLVKERLQRVYDKRGRIN